MNFWVELICNQCNEFITGRFISGKSRYRIPYTIMSEEARSKEAKLVDNEWLCKKCVSKQVVKKILI